MRYCSPVSALVMIRFGVSRRGVLPNGISRTPAARVVADVTLFTRTSWLPSARRHGIEERTIIGIADALGGGAADRPEQPSRLAALGRFAIRCRDFRVARQLLAETAQALVVPLWISQAGFELENLLEPPCFGFVCRTLVGERL